MNEINKKEHDVCLILGSNIRPFYNIPLAIRRLKRFVKIIAISDAWETKAVGTSGPMFVNVAILVCTNLNIYRLKYRVLRRIEAMLGRNRSFDKYAPRTIDIDIVTYDDDLIEPMLWEHSYLAVPCAQVIPAFRKLDSDESLKKIAGRMKKHNRLIAHPEHISKSPIKFHLPP